MIYLISTTIIVLTATGQILLKKGALASQSTYLNRFVVSGYSIFILVALLSIYIGNHLALKYFSVLVSLTYPVTFLFARIFLNEKPSRKTLIACLLIITGSIIFNL